VEQIASENFVSKMTYYVLSGSSNSAHSLYRVNGIHKRNNQQLSM